MHAVLDRPRSIRRVFLVRLFLMLVSDAPKDHDGYDIGANALSRDR